MSGNDLFNNPMVEAAKKAMTPEQREEYKRIGEYMYNTDIYKIKEVGSRVKEANEEDLVIYATQALQSGLDPLDLSQEELRAMINIYGENWYERYGYTRDEVPKPAVQLVTPEDAESEMKRQSRELNYNRRQRRQMKKLKIKNNRI